MQRHSYLDTICISLFVLMIPSGGKPGVLIYYTFGFEDIEKT